jgi:hypothetical protein
LLSIPQTGQCAKRSAGGTTGCQRHGHFGGLDDFRLGLVLQQLSLPNECAAEYRVDRARRWRKARSLPLASRVGEQPVGINGGHSRQIGDHHVTADQSLVIEIGVEGDAADRGAVLAKRWQWSAH